MPANPPYIPRRDAALANWASNFSTLLSSSPTTYGQTSATAAAVAASEAVFASAYSLVTSRSTKTGDTVAAKDTAKASLLALVRPVAVNISKNSAVSTADKVAIGVNPNTSTPSPITPPTTTPALSIQGGASLQLYVRYRDINGSPSVKSKPYGCAFVELHFLVSATPITDVSLLTGIQHMTKSPFLLQFDPSAGGQQCYMAARYVMRNGSLSGFGAIVSMTVPIGH